MIDIKLLEQLCLCNGISGDEGNVRNLIINEIKDCADDIKTDKLGNRIVFKKGKKSAKSKLMVSAHMLSLLIIVNIMHIPPMDHHLLLINYTHHGLFLILYILFVYCMAIVILLFILADIAIILQMELPGLEFL